MPLTTQMLSMLKVTQQLTQSSTQRHKKSLHHPFQNRWRTQRLLEESLQTTKSSEQLLTTPKQFTKLSTHITSLITQTSPSPHTIPQRQLNTTTPAPLLPITRTPWQKPRQKQSQSTYQLLITTAPGESTSILSITNPNSTTSLPYARRRERSPHPLNQRLTLWLWQLSFAV